jgi:prophage antirepressor-like protein
MSQIVKYTCEELDNAEISCLIVNGEPWFNGAEVATLLGYKKPRGAVYDHIPLKYKNKLSFLVRACKVNETRTLELSELNAAWICEAGLYKLILKSKAKTLSHFKIGFVMQCFRKFARLVPICHMIKQLTK